MTTTQGRDADKPECKAAERLPRRLVDDGWWLCSIRLQVSARILNFPVRAFLEAPDRGASSAPDKL